MLWKEVGGSIWSIHCQKSTQIYVSTITNNLLWWFHVTYNATINILLERGQVEVWRRRMTTVADDNGGRWQRWQKTTTRMIGQRTAMGKDKSGQWETAKTVEWWWWLRWQRTMTAKVDNDSGRWQRYARLGGSLWRGRKRAGGKRRQRRGVSMTAAEVEDGGGGQWQQRTTTTAMADDNNGDGGWWQQRTTTAADDNDMQDRVADYEGEGGERAAHNNGIRAHQAESMNKIKKSSLCK